ncbi:hypothetical protein [Streptomyces sp. NPDC057363]|uniref:hypothetical protein n=1 Tax=Streptomyces sp. NPDC057363 TaxID=3346107 RepID=UPI0036412560
MASASARAEAVHIGAWNETPGLLFSMQLPTDGGTMSVHALQSTGRGGRLSPAEGREANLNAPPVQANVMPDIHPPAEGLVAPEPIRGGHVQAKDYTWFQESWRTPPRRASWPSPAPDTPPPAT